MAQLNWSPAYALALRIAFGQWLSWSSAPRGQEAPSKALAESGITIEQAAFRQRLANQQCCKVT